MHGARQRARSRASERRIAAADQDTGRRRGARRRRARRRASTRGPSGARRAEAQQRRGGHEQLLDRRRDPRRALALRRRASPVVRSRTSALERRRVADPARARASAQAWPIERLRAGGEREHGQRAARQRAAGRGRAATRGRRAGTDGAGGSARCNRGTPIADRSDGVPRRRSCGSLTAATMSRRLSRDGQGRQARSGHEGPQAASVRGAPAARGAPLQDRARARRRRLHRRRLRDRRAAGARPAVGQPHGQPVRRLRRHERRLVRRRAGRQRRHARGDDAGRQPAGARRRSATSTSARCCGPTSSSSPRAARCCRCARARLAARAGAAARRTISLMDVVLGLAEGLPSGIYIGAGIEHYIREVLCRPRPQRRLPPARARALPRRDRPRHLRADRLRRRRLGRRPDLARAVRASTALPMVYKPVQVSDRELIDGGIVSTTNLDIAVEAGAKFVVVVNPLVPYVNDFSKRRPHAARLTRRAASATWASRRSATRRSSCWPTSACTRWRASGRQRYPGVDIVLIEPEPDDELMFQTSIMNFTLARRHRPPRLRVGDAASSPRTTSASARSASATGSRSPPRACARSSSTSRAEQEKTRAWRKILEQTTGALLRQSAGERLESASARPSAEGALLARMRQALRSGEQPRRTRRTSCSADAGERCDRPRPVALSSTLVPHGLAPGAHAPASWPPWAARSGGRSAVLASRSAGLRRRCCTRAATPPRHLEHAGVAASPLDGVGHAA